jgi:hypothetical protein
MPDILKRPICNCVDAGQFVPAHAHYAFAKTSGEMSMDQRTSAATAYICPMHSGVRGDRPGKCPICGMSLVPEGSSFAFLRHMLANRLHLTVMIVVMLALMAVMMLMR